MKERWIWELKQDGKIVAEGDTPSRELAIGEAAHYVQQYGQDGPCRAIVRRDEDNFEPPTVGIEVV